MSLTSLPAVCESCFQNVRSGIVWVFSRCWLSWWVNSSPRRSKSNNRIIFFGLSCSISDMMSRRDFPPVFAVSIFPWMPSVLRVLRSFGPSTIIGVPWADSSVKCWMVSWIFSSFSLKCVDKVFFTLLLVLFSRFLGFLLLLCRFRSSCGGVRGFLLVRWLWRF